MEKKLSNILQFIELLSWEQHNWNNSLIPKMHLRENWPFCKCGKFISVKDYIKSSKICFDESSVDKKEVISSTFKFSGKSYFDSVSWYQIKLKCKSYVSSVLTYQQCHVIDWETFKNIGETWLQIHCFLVEHKQTKKISWNIK